MALDPPPYPSNLTLLRGSTMSGDWMRWFQALYGTVQSQPQMLSGRVNLVNQNTSLAATPLPLPSLRGGLYRLSWYARITTPASVSSSLTVTIGWTDLGVPQSMSGAALTANTSATLATAAYMVFVDQAAAVTYATTYASNNANQMKYRLSVLVEQL